MNVDRRTQYRYMTDFIYLLCKLHVVKKTTTLKVKDCDSNMSHVHDAMHYVLTKAFQDNSSKTAVSLAEKFRFKRHNDEDSA